MPDDAAGLIEPTVNSIDTQILAKDCQDGNPTQLGATLIRKGKQNGVNFAVYTHPDAEQVYVSLFDKAGHETERFALHRQDVEGDRDNEHYLDGASCDGAIWHGFIPKLKAGQQYGFRVDGPFEPEHGKTFHINRLLLDPYAKEVSGYPDDPYTSKDGYLDDPSLLNYDAHPVEGENVNARFHRTFKQNEIHDTAASVPKGVVVDTAKLKKKYQPGTPLHEKGDSIILETHPREATIAFDQLPEGVKPGTYNAMASDAFVDWFKGQGFTTLELMPVHLDDANTHWGYMSTNFFAPNPKYADKDDPRSVTEQFGDMVKKLREAGIEVWMDVVYNHTAEGNHLGQVNSFKGLDERYYRKHYNEFLGPHYYDATGTGNTVNTDHPRVRRLIMDSLKHYHDLGVSGFRFDLMMTLGRAHADAHYDPNHPLFKYLERETGQGGALEGVKLSGEPWDCSEPYTVHLPHPIANWDAGHRKGLREAWRLPEGINASSISSVIAGVGDFVKYAVAHDGLAGADAVSGHGYDHREDVAVHAQDDDERFRRQTFGIALEAVSQGAVMRKMGSDRGHHQGGNHNPYDLGSEPVTRIPWGDKLKENPALRQQEIMDFSGVAYRFKKAHPSLRRNHGFSDQPNADYTVLKKDGDKDITWLAANGDEMCGARWSDPNEKAFGFVLSGETGRSLPNGEVLRDTPLMVFVNGSANHSVTYTVPGDSRLGTAWKMAFDSSGASGANKEHAYRAGETVTLPPYTMVAFEASRFPQQDKVNARPVTDCIAASSPGTSASR